MDPGTPRRIRLKSQPAPAGEIRVVDADYRRDYDEIRRIRFAVFVDEQRVPAEIEMDDRDAECAHVLAIVGDSAVGGSAVGTGRIDFDLDGKLGRMAVLAAYRRRGVATALTLRLHELAMQHGLASVWCHAQLQALPFYERLGYRRASDVFVEAGIDHVEMRCGL
jgi:predicted GNAT family N-acyltransferase